MAHASRSRTRVGLPSSPAPRSRSLSARATPSDAPSRPSSAASQRTHANSTAASEAPLPPVPPLPVPHLRHQRPSTDVSLPNAVSRNAESRRIARIPPPPLPVDIRPKRNVEPESESPAGFTGRRNDSLTSISSASSHSSSLSTSSMFSSKSMHSATSSVTSLEDNVPALPPKNDPPSAPAVQPLEGIGTALWNRVAVAAENLTVSVSKAIETNIATYSGEATPPGGESRLTRALKQYHIAKAREPSDLPDWLFEARDRGAIGKLKVTNATPEDDLSRPSSAASSIPVNSGPLQSAQPLPSPWEREDQAPAPPQAQAQVREIDAPIPQLARAQVPISILNAQQRTDSPPGVSRVGTRIRFVEQIHPRQSPGDVLGLSRPPVRDRSALLTAVQPSAGSEMSRGGSNAPVRGARLANVDIRGKRPSARGLPAGVRPARTQ